MVCILSSPLSRRPKNEEAHLPHYSCSQVCTISSGTGICYKYKTPYLNAITIVSVFITSSIFITLGTVLITEYKSCRTIYLHSPGNKMLQKTAGDGYLAARRSV